MNQIRPVGKEVDELIMKHKISETGARMLKYQVLNPEPRDEWGQGDSIADLYAKSGAVVSQVSSAEDLLTFLQSAGTTRHF